MRLAESHKGRSKKGGRGASSQIFESPNEGGSGQTNNQQKENVVEEMSAKNGGEKDNTHEETKTQQAS